MTESAALKEWQSFIALERDRFSEQHNNMFAQTCGKVTKKYRYLILILDRYDNASLRFIENTKASQATRQLGTHPITEEQRSLHEEGWKIAIALELEIDSFYLFAKILLDRVSHVIEFYFGIASRCFLESHDGLTKCFQSFVGQKGLTAPPHQITELLTLLKEKISDYRDYEISHAKKPRQLEAIGFSLETGRTWKNPGHLYPTEKDKFVFSESPRDLIVHHR